MRVPAKLWTEPQPAFKPIQGVSTACNGWKAMLDRAECVEGLDSVVERFSCDGVGRFGLLSGEEDRLKTYADRLKANKFHVLPVAAKKKASK